MTFDPFSYIKYTKFEFLELVCLMYHFVSAYLYNRSVDFPPSFLHFSCNVCTLYNYLFIYRNIPRVLYQTFVNLSDGNRRQLSHKQVLSSL